MSCPKIVDIKYITERIEEALQTAWGEILDFHSIDSGDIMPLQQLDLHNKQAALVGSTCKWIQFRLDCCHHEEQHPVQRCCHCTRPRNIPCEDDSRIDCGGLRCKYCEVYPLKET